MNTNKLIDQLLELQQLVVDFSDIERMVEWPSQEERLENDVEHSYGLAFLAWFVCEKFKLPLKQEKIFKYALIHDLVEVHAGDVPVWGSEEELASKQENEAQAAKQLKSELPFFPQMHQYIYNYEEKADEEARFVYALDKLLPGLVHLLGNRRFFVKNKITKQQHLQKVQEIKEKVAKYPDLVPVYERLMEIYDEEYEFYVDEARATQP